MYSLFNLLDMIERSVIEKRAEPVGYCAIVPIKLFAQNVLARTERRRERRNDTRIISFSVFYLWNNRFYDWILHRVQGSKMKTSTLFRAATKARNFSVYEQHLADGNAWDNNYALHGKKANRYLNLTNKLECRILARLEAKDD